MATGLGERKPIIQTCQTPLKTDFLLHPARMEGLDINIYIYIYIYIYRERERERERITPED